MIKFKNYSTFAHETTFNAKEFEKTLKICEEIIKQQLLPWENLIKDIGADFDNGDIIVLNKELFKDISIPIKFKDNIFKGAYLECSYFLIKKGIFKPLFHFDATHRMDFKIQDIKDHENITSRFIL